jgi:hypothetical protein
MVQQPSIPHDLPTDFDHHVVLFPTRPAATYVPFVPTEPDEPATRRQVSRARARVKKRVIREVFVLEVAGRLKDVVEVLDREVQLALADGARGVVCDLTNVLEGADPGALEVLAAAGRHVRDWPAVPVAVACPDPQVREALRAHPLGAHLTVATSLFSAMSTVLATPTLPVERLRLAPHPTAPRASREFVTRALMGWRLGRVIPFASLVVSELVASSTVDAGTDIDVCVIWDRGALRLTVRDHGPGLPGQRSAAPDLQGRRLTVVAGLSRAFGVLPTADGGQVVWAVLDAPLPVQPASPHGSAAARQESLILSDALALASVTFGEDTD